MILPAILRVFLAILRERLCHVLVFPRSDITLSPTAAHHVSTLPGLLLVARSGLETLVGPGLHMLCDWLLGNRTKKPKKGVNPKKEARRSWVGGGGFWEGKEFSMQEVPEKAACGSVARAASRIWAIFWCEPFVIYAVLCCSEENLFLRACQEGDSRHRDPEHSWTLWVRRPTAYSWMSVI